MDDNSAQLPLLRYRDGEMPKPFLAPITLMGRIVGTYADVVRLEQARSRMTDLYLEDLASSLGGTDMALGLMMDACDYGDPVKITLARGRITYDNPAQLQRFRERVRSD